MKVASNAILLAIFFFAPLFLPSVRFVETTNYEIGCSRNSSQEDRKNASVQRDLPVKWHIMKEKYDRK